MITKMAGKGQQTVMNTQYAVVWAIVVTNLLALQVVLSPFALATSITPPSGMSNSTEPVNTLVPSTEGVDSVSGTATEGILETHSSTAVMNNSAATQPSASQATESIESYSTSINTTQLIPGNASAPSFAGATITDVGQSNSTTVATTAASSNETELRGSTHPPTSIPTTESFTLEMASPTNQTLEVTTLLTTILYTLSFTDTATPTPPTQRITSSTHPDVTTATPNVTTATPVAPDVRTATPSAPDATRTTTTPTPSLTNSQTVPSETPEMTTRSVPNTRTGSPSPWSTQTMADGTQPTTLAIIVTTEAGLGGATSLTVQQWVGIGVGVVLVVILLVVAIILLVWIRTRNSPLSKKPSITVSREEYAKSSTLALKDPTWRQSLNMALQSMNTHIELPKETGEEMQAVDNAAYAEESHDPQTSNQDESHLTKV